MSCPFRALNKKLRAEELLKISKLPPSMAKREQANKKQEALDELDAVEPAPLTKHNVEFSPEKKKKTTRKKVRKTKSSLGGRLYARSYVFDARRDKDKASVKVTRNSPRSIGICYSIALFSFLCSSLT
jgi:hypothetical protein